MNTTIKALIIEDEAPARHLLDSFLQKFPQIDVVAHCSDGFEGARMIMEHKPQLIFLDIQMPRINGFEMLELLRGEDLPLIIFTTAYDEFAIRSFDYNTCDYLLKPISSDRFDKAVGKAIDKLASRPMQAQKVLKLAEQALGEGKFLERIVIRSGNQIAVVLCEDILFLEASDDYVIIHTREEQWVKKQTLRFYEEKLQPTEFVRVHRSFILKVAAVSRIEPYSKDAYIAVLQSGQKVAVSKAGYTRLKEVLGF